VRVLAGDIGGTNSRLLLAEVERPRVEVVHEARYRNDQWPDLGSALARFLEEAPEDCPPEAACVAVAGPVVERDGVARAELTNRDWTIAGDRLAATLGLPEVGVINDFAAIGHGLEALADGDLETLQGGAPLAGAPRALIGAGTGLGQAILVARGDRYEVLPTEGGHTDFGPADDRQIALLVHLRSRFGHVSWERVVSGPGLVGVYRFLAGRGEGAGSPALEAAMVEGDAGAAITRFALERRDPLACEALDLFVAAYGAQAGNLALTVVPRGGLFVAGGIAPAILPALRRGGFMQAFLAKGRMAPVLERIPVRVVKTTRVGLLGAALAALPG